MRDKFKALICALGIPIFFSFSLANAAPPLRDLADKKDMPKLFQEAALETLTEIRATESFFTSKEYSLTMDAISENLRNSDYFKRHPLGETEAKKYLTTNSPIFGKQQSGLRKIKMLHGKMWQIGVSKN